MASHEWYFAVILGIIHSNQLLAKGITIARTSLSTFWFHRICEAVIFVALTIGLFYFVPFFVESGPVVTTFVVDDISAILACIVLMIGVISYFITPKRVQFEVAFMQYLLTSLLVGYLLHSTGGVHSSFIALWLVVAVFASVFRFFGQLAVTTIAISYLAYIYIAQGQLSVEEVIIAALATVLPLVTSYIIFHAKSKKETVETGSYHDLANELSEANSKSDVVIKAIGDGVLALNAKGIIELINPAAQQLLGWNSHDAVNLDYKSVLKLTDTTNKAVVGSTDPIANALATGSTEQTKDLLITTKSSKRRSVSIVASPIGQVGQGVIVVFRDITSELAEEREQAEFISTASHEMRTPVASIEGYLGLALNPNTATIDEKARDYITKAHESAQHLGRLFQDLLDVSKSEDGRLSNHPKVVDVIAFTEDIVESLRVKATEKNLRLFFKPMSSNDETITSTRTLAPIFYSHVDADHLREVLANLVENAIKYTPSGDVIVDVTGDDEHVTISVQDSGIGIPAEDISHLFQKFYRVDNSETREIGGTGLGLYLSRRLAEMMSGRLWVKSEFKKGSTFYLELPRMDRQDALHMIEQSNEPGPEITTSSQVSSEKQHATNTATPSSSQTYDATATPTPIISPIPTPQQPAPPPAPSSAPSLSAIEQNSQAYVSALRERDATRVAIPVRQDSQRP